MRNFLAGIDREYGSTSDYLSFIGFNKEKQQQVIANLKANAN
jgi:hypothetical protein